MTSFSLVNVLVILCVSAIYYDFGMTKHEYMASIAFTLMLQFVIGLLSLVKSIVVTKCNMENN